MSAPDKTLRTGSFIAHVTRGLIREQRARRTMMTVLLLVALLMLVAGSTFLQEFVNPRRHLGWFIAFWLACAWITITALLLAVFDLLIVRAQGRAAQKALDLANRRAPDPANE